MNKNFVILLALPFLLLSCSDNDEKEITKEITLIVASKRDKKDNVDESPSYAYVFYVKNTNSDDWRAFPYEILNFNYKEGNEYTIRVMELSLIDPPQDHPSKEYRLIAIVGIEEKTSEGLFLMIKF